MKRFLYVATIVGVALAATSCGSAESEPVNALVDDFGRTYTASAKAYGTEQVMTEDGKVWNCDIEVVSDAVYEVEFCDNNTEDTADDLISEIIMISEPCESAVFETTTDVTCGFYTTTASKYDESGIITQDGNIWDCDVETIPDATYEVKFFNRGTDDVTDDAIVEVNVISTTPETTAAVSEVATEESTTTETTTTEAATTAEVCETTTAEVINLKNDYYISPDSMRIFNIDGKTWDLGDWWDLEDAYIMSILEKGYDDFAIVDSSLVDEDGVLSDRMEVFGDTVVIQRIIGWANPETGLGLILNNETGKDRYVSYIGTELPEVYPLPVITYVMYNPESNDPEDVLFYEDVPFWDTVQEIAEN